MTKVYGHFSISGSRRNALMEFSEFVNGDYTGLLRHVPTMIVSRSSYQTSSGQLASSDQLLLLNR